MYHVRGRNALILGEFQCSGQHPAFLKKLLELRINSYATLNCNRQPSL